MAKYHLTAAGEVGRCRALLKPCPLGGEHYSSEVEAKNAAELFAEITLAEAAKKAAAAHTVRNRVFQQDLIANASPATHAYVNKLSSLVEPPAGSNYQERASYDRETTKAREEWQDALNAGKDYQRHEAYAVSHSTHLQLSFFHQATQTNPASPYLVEHQQQIMMRLGDIIRAEKGNGHYDEARTHEPKLSSDQFSWEIDRYNPDMKRRWENGLRYNGWIKHTDAVYDAIMKQSEDDYKSGQLHFRAGSRPSDNVAAVYRTYLEFADSFAYREI